MKIALGIQYNGKNYCGWQRQENVASVQEQLEKAISFVANQPCQIFCAGRTDSGCMPQGKLCILKPMPFGQKKHGVLV